MYIYIYMYSTVPYIHIPLHPVYTSYTWPLKEARISPQGQVVARYSRLVKNCTHLFYVVLLL